MNKSTTMNVKPKPQPLSDMRLIAPTSSPTIGNTLVGGSLSRNPFKLIWYNFKMSQKQVELNNTKFWEWEIKYNNFKCP